MLLELLLALSKPEERQIRPSLRRVVQWGGSALLLFMALASWAAPVDSDPEFPAPAMWGLRLFLTFACVAIVISLLRGGRKSRARIPNICPRCHRPLTLHDGGRSCLHCGPGYAASQF